MFESIARLFSGSTATISTSKAPSAQEAAWAALSEHEQFAANRMSQAYPASRFVIGGVDVGGAYADIIRHRGAELPSNPDAYFSKLTYQEQKIAEWAKWRQNTRRIITDADITKYYRDIATWRNI
jgi:hypothetical protein